MLLNEGGSPKVYGVIISVYLFLFVATDCLSADYRDELIAKAAVQKLHIDREWDVLLHYRKKGDSRISVIDDPAFFLAKSGKTDNEAELNATITGFFEDTVKGDLHPQCRFPARFDWLTEKLAIDRSRLPSPVCEKLEKAMAAVDPRTAVLVFPAAHNNGPASMFGHTLLRIGSSYQNELLSHAVNYAAQSEETNGILFAFKGIFGFYPGYYSILPYYEKVKEYNDLEHRDVWEYSLKLKPEEVQKMARHIFELEGIYSDYYFFDENCSFMLLSLLEAARPELRLMEEYWDRWGFWVIPSDTIATVRKAGLIERVKYRPSQATRIQSMAEHLDRQSQLTAADIAFDRVPPEQLTVGADRNILDLAAEYLQYRYSKKEIENDMYRPLFLKILKSRSALGGSAVTGDLTVPPQPEEGHLPAKLSLGAGVRRDKPFLQLSVQPAYHSLLDSDAGYTKGAQIDFSRLTVRYDTGENSLKLQSFYPVDIVSLAPRGVFFKPVSWLVNGGYDRKSGRDGSDMPFYRIDAGAGLAWTVGMSGIAYMMAEGDINLSEHLKNKSAVGAAVSVGLLLNPVDQWKLELSAKGADYLIDNHQFYRVALNQQIALSRNSAVTLKSDWEQSFGYDRFETIIGWVSYF